MNISKLLRVCERYQHWCEAVFLHSNYDQYDNAINIMIEHSPIAFNHDQFVNLLIKASNYDLYYKAIVFYLEEQPEQINELLRSLTTKIDLTKCVSVMRRTGYIALVTPFLKSVQSANNKEANECLNEIYLESYDYESLRQSISTYENFDQLALAQNCERHQLLEFRRISAYLYRRIQKYEFSIALSKQDNIYRDAIETAQESGRSELVEDLLRFFVEKGEKEFISVTLYTAYDLIRPDLAMELAWRFNLFEFVMPYFIQIMKELTSRVDTVQKKHEKREKEEEKKANQQLNQNMFIPSHEIIPSALMIGAPPIQMSGPYGMQQSSMMPQMGMGMGMSMPPMGMNPSQMGMNSSQMGMGMPPMGMSMPQMGGFNSGNPFGQ